MTVSYQLFETSRLCIDEKQTLGTNFHVFYTLVTHAPMHLKNELKLTNSFKVLPPNTIINTEDDFYALDKALSMLRCPIYNLLAAILHLGNVNFENDESGCAQVTEDSNESFECAANLLKISNAQLKNALLSRNLTVHRLNNTESCTMPNDIGMAARTRDSIMKQVYHSLFRFLIENLNEFHQQKTPKIYRHIRHSRFR